MLFKKLILILLLAFTLNLGLQNSRIINNSARNVIENVMQQNYTRDNEEFIKEIEKKRFSEMVKLYINILEINRLAKFYNTS